MTFLFFVLILRISALLGKLIEVNLTSHQITFFTVLTDTDISLPPTRPASFIDIRSPTSTNSSSSSASSLFSAPSSLSSTSSVGSLKMDSIDGLNDVSIKLPSPKPEQAAVQYGDRPIQSSLPATSGLPVVQDDIFNAQTSNITLRKRASPKVIRCPISSPTSLLGFEDQIPVSLASFARSTFGTDLKEVVIAHDKGTQALLDFHQISWGTQYELARGVTLGTWNWEEVKVKIKDLTGDNAHAACQVQTVMRGKPAPSANLSDFYLWYILSHRCY